MPTLPDAWARRRIEDETGSTLFVDAGAGSGKTKSLVDRVATLVLRDGVSLRTIAAVTFTEKAAAELRDRLRARLESALRSERRARDTLSSAGEQESRAADALDDLDGAAIGTLHSFAQRILTMHPIEAGLPPLLEVLDEVGSSVAFDERWSVVQRELLDDPGVAPQLRLAFAAGATLEQLRSLARAFQSDWDLIDSRVLADGPPAVPLPDARGLAAQARTLAAQAGECTAEDDRFLPRLEALAAWAEQYADAGDPETQVAGLIAVGDLKWGYGQQGNWGGRLAEIRQGCQDWQQRATAALTEFTEAALRPLAHWLASRVLDAARARAQAGTLEFHDLLVLSRDLLRRDASVRATLQQQYGRLLLDEFQDTDPIQIEIAARIAGGAEADAADWHDIGVPPGSLFVVGDPKQSIYRFRRADIRTYLHAQAWVDDAVTLHSNFRTVAPVLAWVNTVFESVITPVADAQPAYVPLAATRESAGTGPPVVVLGSDVHEDKPDAAMLRTREAVDVAAVVRQAMDDRWTTQAGDSWRPLTLGDIAILVPARTSLPFLEDALEVAGIPYRAESSSLVYQAREVRDLLAAVRAVADPSDRLACVTALRSALFGCGDDDLWTWKRDGGSFNLLAPVPDERAGHLVGQGLAYLRRLHYESRWMAPSDVLRRLVTDRRMVEVAAGRERARDQWRRLRFVVDQARAWSETQHGGLRAYLAWAARQGEETARVAEAVLPETDVDAVRVMTVHAAKGLEFPMVVLSGMSSAPRSPRGVRLLWSDSGYAVKLSSSLQTNDFEHLAPVDEQMDAYERRRLLYVATTRARDHLVVSLHRKAGTSTNAGLLAEAGAASGAITFARRVLAEPAAVVAAAAVRPAPSWQAWSATIANVREASRQPSAVSASGLEGTEPSVTLTVDTESAGHAKGPRDLELPPWSKGRYGTAIGRAVHGVLQSIDLATGDGLADAVGAQAVAEGVVAHTDVVQALVRSALDCEVVRRAAAREHWREMYVGTVQPDATVLEGFIDLVYREDDQTLVIVDYKTDAVPAAALASRDAYYRPQLQAYRQAVVAATGATVRAVLLYLAPGAAVAREVVAASG